MSIYPYQKQSRSKSKAETLLKPDTPVKLTQPFKGMLFTQELSFIAMEMEQAIFTISHGRLLVNPGDRIFLHSSSAAEVFTARVIELDNYRGRLVLEDIKSLGRTWAKRSHDRVQPHQPTRVMLSCKDCFVPTFLENLSLAGVGLLIYKPVERGLEPRIGHNVKVDFELPGVRGRLSLSGKLVNVSYPGERLAYVGIQIHPSAQQAYLMERYITDRKREIIDEIDEVIHASFVPPSVQDMYF